MNPTEATTKLAQLFQSGRHFNFLRLSRDLLASNPNATELSALKIQALTALGYGGPARELAQHFGNTGVSLEQRNQLDDSLRKLPNGRVPWTELQEVYEANRSVFLGRYPRHEDWLTKATTAVRKLHLFRTNTGRLHLSRRQPGRLREWILDLCVEPEELGLKLPDEGHMHVPAIIGVSLGSLLTQVCERSEGVFLNYNHPIFVLEFNPLHFSAWMHGTDHRPQLTNERIEWFVGPDCLDDFETHLQHNDAVALPHIVLNQTDDLSPTPKVQSRVTTVQEHRRESLNQLTARLNEYYQPGRSAEYADRLSPPHRVLGLTSRFTSMLQYSTRDAIDALKKAGYQTHFHMERADHHTMTPTDICKVIDDFKPDLLVVLDHLRHEYKFLPANLPMLSWIQDPLPDLLCKEAGQSVKTPDFVCGLFRDRCIEQFDYPPEQFEYVDVPVSPRVFHDAQPSPEALQEYECDVSFISNASMTIEEFRDTEIAKKHTSLQPLMLALFDAASQVIDDDAFCLRGAYELTNQIGKQLHVEWTPDEARSFAIHYVYRIFDWGRRQRTLEWVSKWANQTGRTFKLFGRGWENHPNLSAHACGLVEHGSELREVYRASRISLQLIPSGFRHQRSLEIIASGSLPLTRFCEGDFGDLPASEFRTLRDADQTPAIIPDFPNFQEIVFTSPQDFAQRAEMFLSNEAKRDTILQDLRDHVHANYTYDAAIKMVLPAFQKHLRNRA